MNLQTTNIKNITNSPCKYIDFGPQMAFCCLLALEPYTEHGSKIGPGVRQSPRANF